MTMDSGMLLAGLLLSTCLLLWGLWMVLLKLKAKLRYPPVESGWIPWLGCAVAFGKAPLLFIQQTKEKLGDIFTIHAAGKMMTFVTNPRDYHHYFTTTTTDFQAAVQPFTMRAAGVPAQSFFKHHSAIHDTIKGQLIPSYLTSMCPSLSAELNNSLSCHGNSGEAELMDFVRDPMFEAVVRQLFGKENVPATRPEMRSFMHKFIKYDADFEYGAELPEIFLREWRDSRNWLLSAFKHVISRVKAGKSEEKKPTVLEHLLRMVDPPSAHNYALLLLWASQANAIPMVFWTMAYILADPEVYKSVRKEMDEALPQHTGGDDFVPVQESALKQMPLIKRCVLEAVRLHAPGMITRKVVRTHSINGYTVPAGHLLMLSPYWSHRNPHKFPEPEKFKPDRWLECDLDKAQLLDGFVGFGGGRYQCPGRWFALMEMQLFIAMLLQQFNLELLDPLPLPSPLHLVGTQQPMETCRVKFSRRT
ncbi:24-hydroxycholesterol 7-alpha-hydroxylase-like [Halichondria panicea]|uniref:24-hydroxycholesterol 7-alpha-hydroxylase-like n=1 Tax=Halichondria panicea TaxID=6063 RepID=UPI00312B6D08